MDDAKGDVRIGGRLVDGDARAIEVVLAPLIGALLPRKADVVAFRRGLAAAIDARSSGAEGAAVDAVYRQLVIDAQTPKFWRNAETEAFSPLTRDQFRARFSWALEAGTTMEDGRHLRLEPPLRTDDGLFVWQPAERRFAWVGRVRLEAAP